MRYTLKNKDVGPRYIFAADGMPRIVNAGDTSAPAEFSDVEIEAARDAVDHDGNPLWEIEEVADDAQADNASETPLNKLDRDGLLAKVAQLRESGMVVDVADDATKAKLLEAIKKATAEPAA